MARELETIITEFDAFRDTFNIFRRTVEGKKEMTRPQQVLSLE